MALKEIEKARLLENSRQGMPSSALAAFERMEEQHQRMESLSQKAAELTGIDMETQFAMLESGDRADDELRRMKEELLGTAHHQTQAQLDGVPSTVKPVVDDELERLKKKLDDL